MQVTAKRHRVTPTQARDWIRLARECGILEPADSTRPSGELTAKGRRLLTTAKASLVLEDADSAVVDSIVGKRVD